MVELTYLAGFGNEHQSEALPGALPVGQFSPQNCPYNLYAEQLSTSAFTRPRAHNRRSWLYRIQPSVCQGLFQPISAGQVHTAPLVDPVFTPNPLRWSPIPASSNQCDFIDSLITIAANGNAASQIGVAIHWYCAQRDMHNRYFCCADGELLFIPLTGDIELITELGRIQITPGEIAVIPRGIKFQVKLLAGPASGYLCENYGSPFELPERGTVGANGFANNRDFLYPVAWFEDTTATQQIITKYCGHFFAAEIDHSPLNVVAWTGNSAPYKYDLARFNSINSVSFDHCDPSIFTVLSSASDTQGMANIDFVVFPPRWVVAEETFRPPWFHRNIMSEFMGLIKGQYDGKSTDFKPGGMSIHNCMTAHGPDSTTFDKASKADLKPHYQADALAFMIESRYPISPTKFAFNLPQRQINYHLCWQKLNNNFTGRI
ncbi:MAG: homogentisate 1,2-dioxygenase [Pseudomonadales bacterium]|nr:homogentisate 1,2-dioxygenase [Pseudomonadales bacterium]